MLRVAIIGAGKIAKEHLKVLDSIDKVEVISIASRSFTNADLLAKKYNIKVVYTDYKTMLTTEKIDIVYIAVSVNAVNEIATYCINSQIKCFIEKPVGLSLLEVEKLNNLAKENCVKCVVGVNRRFYSTINNAYKKLSPFKIYAVHIEGFERLSQIREMDKHKVNLKDWIFANLIHTVDLFSYLCDDEFIVINTLTSSLEEEYGDSFIVNAKSKQNILASYISHWHSPGGWSVEIFAKGVRAIIKPLEHCEILYEDGTKELIELDEIDIQYKAGFYEMHMAFIDYILNDKIDKRLVTLDKSLVTANILETMSLRGIL